MKGSIYSSKHFSLVKDPLVYYNKDYQYRINYLRMVNVDGNDFMTNFTIKKNNYLFGLNIRTIVRINSVLK